MKCPHCGTESSNYVICENCGHIFIGIGLESFLEKNNINITLFGVFIALTAFLYSLTDQSDNKLLLAAIFSNLISILILCIIVKNSYTYYRAWQYVYDKKSNILGSNYVEYRKNKSKNETKLMFSSIPFALFQFFLIGVLFYLSVYCYDQSSPFRTEYFDILFEIAIALIVTSIGLLLINLVIARYYENLAIREVFVVILIMFLIVTYVYAITSFNEVKIYLLALTFVTIDGIIKTLPIDLEIEENAFNSMNK